MVLLLPRNFYHINQLDNTGKTPLEYANPESKLYRWLVTKGVVTAQDLEDPESSNKAEEDSPPHVLVQEELLPLVNSYLRTPPRNSNAAMRQEKIP